MIAARYLRARRREGFISVSAAFSFLGVMLGVAVLIIVMAVMNGFRAELMGKILGVNGHVVVQPIGSDLTDYVEVTQRIGAVPGVRLAMPLVEGQALASSASNAGGVLVRGVLEADLKRSGLIGKSIQEGTLEDFDNSVGVVIGRKLAEQLGIRVGDILTLVSPRGAVTPMGTAPRIKGYPVRGIYEVGMSEYDAVFVFLPLAEAQAYFNRNNDVSAIEVFLDDPEHTERMRGPIQEATQRQVQMTDWRQRNVTFFSALEVERNVMFLILTLIVLVADLNIISSLIMLVKEKGQNIAILRTVGASRGTIMRIFMITGAAIGFIGTIVGVLLGLLVCAYVDEIRQAMSWLTSTELFSPELYFLSRLPAKVDVGETVSVVLMALALSLVASIYPAWRASRLDPVEALRYE
ncbi:lipoprotein-releasing ABC transporter permease subunit [Terrihabitans rhizophilus]|jgi:lipoprotein-releasing system permease protein|uniref:Lipoprotein-releasing ABC transporter permease subunit n=1 Tax=Terrihabitans rhizophilus TaxID=3092662 RepID=A0ABU4RKW0_9HYPH|nr:lipoprotein-releasing ABC transporter permease subunit [Terrihabitans sp. PJ23]MDX6805478.1 lipoprotein-releasing ABC transporter permease subunit [Terrihabitans sp. PJ23]